MTEQEFHSIRNPFYLDPNTSKIVFPLPEYENSSHIEWFKNIRISINNIVRGYYYKCSSGGDYVMLYWKDFEIPNINIEVVTYIFDYFPNINWIGLGCHKGKIGEIWEPKLIINKNKYEK